MKFLITNDDGIDSKGLYALAQTVAELGHEAVVAAPSKNMSGVSASLMPFDDHDRVAVEELEIPDLEGIKSFSVGAPPALIVMLSMLGGFGDPPDMVASGVNLGPNTGRSTLFSGTIAAVKTAARFDRSGIAVSINYHPSVDTDEHWETAKEMTAQPLQWLTSAPNATMLNLNIPNKPLKEVLGFRQADLAHIGRVQTVITSKDSTGIDIELEPCNDPVPEGTDSALLEKDYATATTLEPAKEADIDLPTEQWE